MSTQCFEGTIEGRLTSLQDGISLEKVRERIRSEEITSKGIQYLEHEPLTITSPTGRRWKVYGSPVRLPILSVLPRLTRTSGGSTIFYRRLPVRNQDRG